jgi:hypothetical protein
MSARWRAAHVVLGAAAARASIAAARWSPASTWRWAAAISRT